MKPIFTVYIALFTIVCVLVAMPASKAHAQETKMPSSAYDIDNIPDSYIEEAYAFYGQCESSIEYRQYYDCECLSAKYLDTRIKNGPRVGKSNILMQIDGECPDTTHASGYYYNTCMSNASLTSVDMPIDEYCECFANQYGKIYERLKPEPNSRNFVAIQTEAMKVCSNPDRARRLNEALNNK